MQYEQLPNPQRQKGEEWWPGLGELLTNGYRVSVLQDENNSDSEWW